MCEQRVGSGGGSQGACEVHPGNRESCAGRSDGETIKGEGQIGVSGVLELLFRSFYLQAGWNYEALQALGFAYVMSPICRRLAAGKEVSADFKRRHLALFNTNPVLASYIIGAVAKLEEEHERGERSAADIKALKDGLTSPLAAIGDHFFWAHLRPFAGAVGVLVAGFSGAVGALLLLAIYNTFHLYYRAKGVVRGYTLGVGVVGEIPRLKIMKISRCVGWAGAFVLGVLLVTRAYTWNAVWRWEAIFVFTVVAIASGFLPGTLQKRITEIALAVGATGLLLTATGVLG